MTKKELIEKTVNIPDDAEVELSICVVCQYPGDHDCFSLEVLAEDANLQDGKLCIVGIRNEEYDSRDACPYSYEI